MRSELVFAARHTLGNRYMLCQAAAKATRKFHRSNTRVEETTNEVLQHIAVSERDPVRRQDNEIDGRRRRLSAYRNIVAAEAVGK